MTTQTMGTLRLEGERRAVRHERHYDATPAEVWAALTEPDQVRNWLAEMTIEPRAGGRVTFKSENGGGNTDEGVVRVFDPPTTFEYTWEKGAQSVVRFDLVPDDNGTLLILEHSQIKVDSAASIGAGWHTHLDAMQSLLRGSAQTPDEWDARYEGLLPGYEAQASTL